MSLCGHWTLALSGRRHRREHAAKRPGDGRIDRQRVERGFRPLQPFLSSGALIEFVRCVRTRGEFRRVITETATSDGKPPNRSAPDR
jgi:hypothetical protein